MFYVINSSINNILCNWHWISNSERRNDLILHHLLLANINLYNWWTLSCVKYALNSSDKESNSVQLKKKNWITGLLGWSWERLGVQGTFKSNLGETTTESESTGNWIQFRIWDLLSHAISSYVYVYLVQIVSGDCKGRVSWTT